MTARLPSVLVVVAAACSTPGPGGSVAPVDASDAADAADAEAQAQLAGDDASCDSRAMCDAGTVVLGAMRLFELSGTAPSTAGPSAVKVLEAAAAFHAATPGDYDDRQADIGCTADHYDATARPAPADADAGWLRMSGFTGGALLAGGQAGQPIVCTRTAGYYRCAYPTGTIASDGFFSASASPLGPGPITFALNGAADFGARAVSGSPVGTATTAEDLTAVHYSASADAVFHVSCADSCTPGRIAVDLVARQVSTASVGWPYPSVGIVRCVFAPATSIAIPHGAIAAMFAEDTTLDSVVTSVALLPMEPLVTSDAMGNRLIAEVGRGTFGVAPR
jgi:hypothetical protein